MYSTGRDLNPSKPVITSLTQANRELALWMRENNVSSFADADGLLWTLKVKVSENPAKDDTKRRHWRISFKITAQPNAEEFLRTGTLDSEHDARLIAMLADRRVPLHMRPFEASANSIEEARTVFAQSVVDLRTRLSKQSLHDTKRHLISRFVDEQAQFRFKT